MQQSVCNPLFRRGPSRHSFDPSPQAYPGRMTWDYDRIEIIADGIIHATGISLGLVGAIAIIIVAVDLPRIEITSIVIYILGLVAMLVISGAYNMWPISPTKWILRRFDHSAIYLLIAGTYMPFLAQMKSSVVAVGLGIGVWASAVIGGS
jgi:hemolysin III